MALVLENALLVDLDPMRVARDSLRIDDGKITARGANVRKESDDVVDCGGCVVMPGMVNGHTHLYSALAAGMPPPPKTPRNFHEILKYIWWRLDRALDMDAVRLSAAAGALEAVRCGTTALIDHHASPNAIAGSLDAVEAGLAAVGVRGVLCYEVTDRNGMAGRDAGVEENRRYLQKCREQNDGKFAALVGAHASFTCGDDTMERLAGLVKEFDTGLHIHVAEDAIDEKLCREEHGVGLIERLDKFGFLRNGSIFAHGTHLGRESLDRMGAAGVALAHNTRSNMNNAVGYTSIGAATSPIQLGTDGIGADMFAELQTAWFKSCDGGAGITPAQVIAMEVNSARRASRALGVALGKLEVGAEADIVLTNYQPSTPLADGSLAGHLIYVLGSQHVASVMFAGEWVVKDGVLQTVDEKKLRTEAHAAAVRTAKALEGIE